MVQLTSYKKNNITILKIKGDIDLEDVVEIEGYVNELISNGSYNILVNCIDISFISSSDISMFLKMYHKLRAERGELKLCNQNTFIQKVLRITSLECIFPYFKDEDSALKTFNCYRRVI